MKEFSFKAHGHANVRATHPTTIEITTDDHLTPRGDCIIAVSAEKGFLDFPEQMKTEAKRSDATIRLILENGIESVIVTGKGDPRLTWAHPTDIVTRTSGFACDRTLMVRANKAAKDLAANFVSRLKDPKTVINVTVQVYS